MNILYTVSTQYQYSDVMYAVGYTVRIHYISVLVLLFIDGI